MPPNKLAQACTICSISASLRKLAKINLKKLVRLRKLATSLFCTSKLCASLRQAGGKLVVSMHFGLELALWIWSNSRTLLVLQRFSMCELLPLERSRVVRGTPENVHVCFRKDEIKIEN